MAKELYLDRKPNPIRKYLRPTDTWSLILDSSRGRRDLTFNGSKKALKGDNDEQGNIQSP